EKVIARTGLELNGEERTALVAHGTLAPEAQDFYLRALGYLQDYHKAENVNSAIELFQRALELDKKYALPYAGLGEAYWARYDETHEKQWLDKAMQACKESVNLAPDLENGHTCLGRVYMDIGRDEQALHEIYPA